VLACPVGKLRRFMRRGNDDIARPGIKLAPCYRTVATMDAPLVGGFVQRVGLSAVGGREIAMLRVRIPAVPGVSYGENVHLVITGGMGVGVVDEKGRARLRDALRGPAARDQARWRAQLEGGRVVAVEGTSVAVAHADRTWCARTDGAGALALIEEPSRVPETDLQREDWLARGARIVDGLVRAEATGSRESLRRALVKAIARLDRRIDAVRGDLARAQGADAQADRARLFVAAAARAPRGATRLAAVDWSSGEAKTIEIPLDPARGAQEQLASLFKRARRLKEGGRIALARLEDAEHVRAALAAVMEALATGEDADVEQLEARARAAAPRDFRFESARALAAGAGARLQPPRPPYRAFVGLSGARIWVGRGAAHNDVLTFHLASPHHLWLHAKNRTGAHVIVPLERGGTCPADVLVEAAHLAAHFSEARDEALVEVQYTPRRYLRKPRGSPPGLVVVDREKVIVLRREEGVLRRLLEREAVAF